MQGIPDTCDSDTAAVTSSWLKNNTLHLGQIIIINLTTIITAELSSPVK